MFAFVVFLSKKSKV